MKRVIVAVLSVFAVSQVWAGPLLDAEAAEYLKTLAEKGKNYQRRADKTYFFSRGQLKYGLERKDYLRHWSDRPLMQESGFAKSGEFQLSAAGVYTEKGFINRNTYITESNLLKKYNFAGYALFVESSGRLDIFDHAGAPGTGDIKLLTEFFVNARRGKERRNAAAARALKSPHAFRLDGKVVITSYPGVSCSQLKYWIEMKEEFKTLFGDKFLFMPYVHVRVAPTGKNNALCKADIMKMEENVRTCLRAMDGLYLNSPPFKDRRYHWGYDTQVMIPVVHAVMSEPEFRNKYLGWGTKVGHMNCHRQSFGIDAFNTDTLRGTVGAAVAAKADIVNGVEWDEENENTCFRPMTMTGFSTLRICRAFEQLANEGKYSPLPGDDLSIPNLVLSYPRVLAAGQLIEVEVANIPDGSGKAPAEVAVGFRDNAGKIVWQSEKRKLDHNSVCAEVFPVQSETLLKHRFLNPFIIVDGKSWDNGFYPVEIRAWWHWDYLYAKHVLRDMPKGVKAELSFSKPDEHGLTNVNVKVSSPENLRSIEVISGDNLVVYSHDSNGGSKFRESAERAAFRISLQGMMYSPVVLNGSVRFLNMPDIEVYPQNVDKKEWKYKEHKMHVTPIHRFISIPRKDLDKAAIEIDLPGLIPEKTVVKLADVQKLGSYGINGKHSSQLVIVRNNLPEQMPDVLGGKEYEFSVPVRHDLPEAGYLVQVIDKDYRMYRSKKVSPFVPGEKTVKYNVVSVGQNKCAVAEASEDLLKPVTYDFSGKNGSIIKCSVGSRWDGILAGFVPMATGFGQAAFGNGNGVFPYITLKNTLENAAPVREKVDGKDTLVFKGAQYVSLPLGMIPPYGSYEIEMDVYVEKDGSAKQTLLSSCRQAFSLQLINRVPVVRISCSPAARRASGPRLKLWQWNKIKVRFDQENLSVIVDGVPGKPVPACGFQRYPRATSLGASEQGEFFYGKIRDFRITPYVKNEK